MSRNPKPYAVMPCDELGTTIGIYRRSSGLARAPWALRCETHGDVIGELYLSLARGDARAPQRWCGGCLERWLDLHPEERARKGRGRFLGWYEPTPEEENTWTIGPVILPGGRR